MKKLCAMLALLLCLGACGAVIEPPTETPTTSAETTTAEAATFPEMTSDEIYEEIFQPAIELYSYLTTGGFSSDWEDRFEHYEGEQRSIYTRITDPRYPSIAAVEEAAREFFSEELTQSYLTLANLTEKDGKLYTLDQSRGIYLSMESIRVESQSENKIIYILHAVDRWDEDDPVISKEFSYTRELIGGKWVFTIFPMEWY